MIDDLAPLLHAIVHAGERLTDRAEASFGDPQVSFARVGLLYHLQGGARSLGELADVLQCRRSNMTSMVDRLERDGWVVRRSDPDDRRVSKAELTDQGRDVLERALESVARVEQELRSSITPDEVDELLSLLRRL